MEKKTAAVITALMLLLASCAAGTVEWNGEKEVFADLLLVVDCSDLQEYVGAVTHVFSGTVFDVEKNVIPEKAKQHEDLYSVYKIHVDESLKGEVSGDITCFKLGGFKRDGTMLVVRAETPDGTYITDSGMPEKGRKYIFLAYEQQDGRMLLSEILDDREYSDELRSEYARLVGIPAWSTGEISDDGKEILKLRFRPMLDEELESEPKAEAVTGLYYSGLPEITEQHYSDELGLDVFADFIKDRFAVELDSRWKVFVHYYDTEQTVGMAEFMYTIGDIDTNKSVIFNLDNGRADTVYSKHLDAEADEEDLLRRVEAFRARYAQEKRELQEGEEFESEKTSFVYYYNSGRLLYSYSFFFSYDEGIINNDYATVCFIDEQGGAVL